jgi:hypothetical protein
MGRGSAIRAMEAAHRRQQRDAKTRQRDLERQVKESAKLSALEKARLEVDTYENGLDVLLSVHKEQTDPFEWPAFAASLPPVPPARMSRHELKARQRLALSSAMQDTEVVIADAQQADERDYQAALQAHAADHAEWEKMSRLARRILQGDSGAYIEAIEELSPFAELDSIGSSLHFSVHSPRLIEVALTTNGRQAIPSEVKVLTASGKVSIKSMPAQRFIEIYQDYVCGCVLRVARELFALLPIESLLISASTGILDTSTGQTIERPFLSVAIPRTTLAALNFNMLDPSDSIMSMAHRGDLKASRKTGEFEFITPMTVSDLPQQGASTSVDLNTLLVTAQRLRADLAAQCAALNHGEAS